MSMGSERRVDNILESCVLGIGSSLCRMESFLPIQKCSDDDQRYKVMCPATAMGGRFLFCVAGACVCSSLVVIRWRVAGRLVQGVSSVDGVKHSASVLM